MANKSVSLDEELDEWVNKQLAEGRYKKFSHAVQHGLRLLQKHLEREKTAQDPKMAAVLEAYHDIFMEEEKQRLRLLRERHPSIYAQEVARGLIKPEKVDDSPGRGARSS